MTRQIILFKTTERSHHEVADKFYQYESMSQELEIAHKLAEQHGIEGFVQVLDGDGAPIRSFKVTNISIEL